MFIIKWADPHALAWTMKRAGRVSFLCCHTATGIIRTLHYNIVTVSLVHNKPFLIL